MTELTAKRRNTLPESKFALPETRQYPVDTKNRAANAKARAQQQYDKGNISKATLSKVDRKANGILHRGKGGLIGVKKRKRGLLITDHGDVNN